jgi:capsular exopolysaccharide synthesis family protein
MLPAESKSIAHSPLALNHVTATTLVPVPSTADGLPPAMSSEGMDGALMRALRRCWLMAVGLGLAGGAVAAALLWFVLPAKYTAQALVHLASHPSRTLLAPNENPDDFQAYARTQATLVKSRAVLQAAVRQPQVAELSEIRDCTDPAGWLADALVVDSLLGPEIVRVSLTGDSAENVAVVVNAVVKAYLQEVVNAEKIKQQARIAELMDNLRGLEDTVRRKRIMLKDLEASLGVDDPQTVTLRYQSALQQLALAEKERLTAQIALANTQLEVEAERKKQNQTPSVPITDLTVDLYLKQDAAYQKLVARQLQVQEDIARINSIASKEVRDGQLEGPSGQLAAIDTAMAARRREVRPLVESQQLAQAQEDFKTNLAKLEARVPLLQEQFKGLDAEVKRLETQAKRFGAAIRQPDKPTSDLEALRDEVAQGEKVIQKAGDQLYTLKVEPAIGARASLLEAAEVPISPTLKSKIKIVGLGGMGTFGLIVMGISWREYRRRRVYEVDDVVQGLGMYLIGTLPALPASARRTLPVGTPGKDVYWQALLTEAVDGIRTQLLHAAYRESLRVLMVTSAAPGEGKTSLAGHLAASLARARRKVLLIDGDLRNPGLHKNFNIPLQPGFADVLRGEAPFENVIRPTGVPRLALVPAGKWDSEAYHALAQMDRGSIFDTLKEPFDFIIVDSSPVLSVADALVLGQHVDGVVFSILREVSRLPEVYGAQQRLATLGIRLLGAVVVGTTGEANHMKYQYPKTGVQ